MPGSTVTLLHLSDLQFGRNHLFGGVGAVTTEEHLDALFTRLEDDLAALKKQYGVDPDAIVVSGDLAEEGAKEEFAEALRFLRALAEATGVPRRHFAVIPGNHDINRPLCQSYFLEQRGDGEEPKKPYWRKWKHFERMYREFYGEEHEETFTLEAPWSLFEMPDLALVVAGLNSTLAESHLEEHHYGFVGEHQARWFARRLERFEDRGWLRVAAVHHNMVRGPVQDDENLRDVEVLEGFLGRSTNLFLHGHTHDAKLHWTSARVPIISTGSASLRPEARPHEVPNQYQLLQISRARITRWARSYEPDKRRWAGDNRLSDDLDEWVVPIDVRFDKVDGTFPTEQSDDTPPPPEPDDGSSGHAVLVATDDFLARVGEVCRIRSPDARVTRVPGDDLGLEYLRVAETAESARVYPLGAFADGISRRMLTEFIQRVHDVYRAVDPIVASEIVYGGPPAPPELHAEAARAGVRLTSFLEYQRMLDLREYVAAQTHRLDTDPLYPPALYVPQRFEPLEETEYIEDGYVIPALLRWLAAPAGRFVLVLGEFGSGKTFLLHELARRIPQELPNVVPLLIELRALEKARTLKELVVQHLVGQGVDRFDVRAFEYMLRNGRLALLFDGYDELVPRVTYERATEHFQRLLDAYEGEAKVVLTSRTQHFISDEQVTTVLGERLELLAGRRMIKLKDFDDDQILAFLVHVNGGDRERARSRLDLLADVRDLLGLSKNPRMLSFIAALDEEQLADRPAEITAAGLYQLILDQWLRLEYERSQPRGAAPALSVEERWRAVTSLALQLWRTTDRGVYLTHVSAAVADMVDQLAESRFSQAEAVHAVASGTLLVRPEENMFAFVHQSVAEWLVANHAAERLRAGDLEPEGLGEQRMSSLMVDFFAALAGPDLATEWARRTVAAETAGEAAKANALAVLDRTGQAEGSLNLAGERLRGESLAGRFLVGADLSDADLTDALLVDADLRRADMRRVTATGARGDRACLERANLEDANLRRTSLVDARLGRARLAGASLDEASLLGADLRGAVLDRTTWRRARLVGARLDDGALDGLDTTGAALPGATPTPQFAAGSESVAVVAVSLTLQMIAAGGDDGVVRLWGSPAQRLIRTIRAHDAGIVALGFVGDQTLVTVADDTTVSWTNLVEGAVVTRQTIGLATRRVLDISRDGRFLAVGDGPLVVVYDAESAEPIRRLVSHSGPVQAVAFGPDGSLASGGRDRRVVVWGAAGAEHPVASHTFEDEVTCLVFASEDEIVVGGGDGLVGWWTPGDVPSAMTRLRTKRAIDNIAVDPASSEVMALTHPDAAWRVKRRGKRLTASRVAITGVEDLRYAPDGNLVVAGADGVSCRDPGSFTRMASPDQHSLGSFSAVAVSGEGSLAAVHDDTLVVMEATWTKPPTVVPVEPAHRISSIAFAADGPEPQVVSGDAAGFVVLHRWQDGGWERIALSRHRDEVVSIASGGGLVVSASSSGEIHVVDLETREQLYARETNMRLYPNEVVLDARTGILAWRNRRDILAIDAREGSALPTVRAPGLLTVLPHGRGGTVAAVAEDVHIVDVLGGEARAVARDERRPRAPALVAPTAPGGIVAGASARGRITLRGLAGPSTPPRVLDAHSGAVTGLAFDGHGSRLFSASLDGTLRAWDVASGAWLAALVGLNDGFAAVTRTGEYKLWGSSGEGFWYADALCRFERGELDRFDGPIRALADDAAVLPPS